MKKIWPFSFYFLYFAALSSFMPFIVLFYQELQFNGTQIGLLTGIPPLITLVAAPFWTGVADASRRHRLIMSLGIATAAPPHMLESADALLSAADQALYRAKGEGRNRCEE